MTEVKPYGTRSLAFTFEIPFIDLGDPTYVEETEKLVKNINSSYYDWFEVLVQGLQLLDRGPRNPLLLYHCVVRTDNISVDSETIESQWENMKSEILNAISDYLKTRNVNFEISA